MDTNRLKKFATEARNILIQGVSQRLLTLGYDTNGQVVQEPTLVGGGAIFLGETVSEDFYHRWQNMRKAIERSSVKEVVEEAAYTWFNRLTAIRIMVRNGLLSPVLEYESEDVRIPLIVSEARQGRLPEMDEYRRNKLNALLDDDSKTDEQFALLIVAFCHATPVINRCFGTISDYTELLLPQNILSEGGFVDMLNDTPFISEDDYKSPELIGWLYQYYISEKKDDVFASFKKGKKAEAEDIPAATQIFTPNWIVKYMVQNTVGRIYLDNNPYSEIKDSMKYLVEPEEPTPDEAIFHFDDIHDLTCADLACGSGHILNECFDILYQIYVEEGYSRKKTIEDIFKYNLTGVDLDTRAKQLAQFALLLKACQKDSSFADAHCMPKVLDMPKPYDADTISMSLESACLKFIGGYESVAGKMLEQDMELINDANNLGSIMKFNDDKDYLTMLQHYYDDWTDGGIDDCPEEIQALIPGVELILTLTKKYATLIANPPYMGSNNMNVNLSSYLKVNYPCTKEDLFSVFMQMMIEKNLAHGRCAFVTMESWMYLSSFADFRESIVDNYYIDSLVHLGWYLLGIGFGTCISVIEKYKHLNRTGEYSFVSIEKIDESTNAPLVFPIKDEKYCRRPQATFQKLEGTPIAYNVSDTLLDIFQNGDSIDTYIESFQGIITGDNVKFLRYWSELSLKNISLHSQSFLDVNLQTTYWIPYNKGGDARRWYGIQDYVVYWKNGSKDKTRGKEAFSSYYLKEYVAWSYTVHDIIHTRYYPAGFLWDVRGSGIFDKSDSLFYLQAMICSKVGIKLLRVKNATISCQVENILQLPIIMSYSKKPKIEEIVEENISISRQDWDAHETSWDFVRNELLTMDEDVLLENINYQTEQHFKKTGEHICVDPASPMPESVEWCYGMYCCKWERMFLQLHENEEELNRQFIEIYGLQKELTPDVHLDEITILQQGEVSIENDKLVWHSDAVMKQLISYAVGCMMGRYSIDRDGLILANQGDGIKEYNELVPNSRFEVDDDGIVPLMASDTDFADNATKRFKQWLSIAFGEDMLVENLNFIEAAIGKSIDDYFVKDFWKDHKKMYQNRPIYWLFSSKKGAFQCLAYMHRMNPYTAELIRTKYLLPHIEWLLNKQQDLQNDAANLTARERKELDNITKQIAECREYHDKLHAISQDYDRLTFDLDDGVVVNYEKFGDVLAKLK